MAAPEIAKGDQRVENAQKGFADTFNGRGEKSRRGSKKIALFAFLFFFSLPKSPDSLLSPLLHPLDGGRVSERGSQRERVRVSGCFFFFCLQFYMSARVI